MFLSTMAVLAVAAFTGGEQLPVPQHFDPASLGLSGSADTSLVANPLVTCPAGEIETCVPGYLSKPICTCLPGGPPASQKGSLTPSFYVLTVYYQPPGSGSTMNYTTSTVLGSSTSNTSTWQNSISITASVGAKMAGPSATVTATHSWGSTESDEDDITMTTTEGYTIPGLTNTYDPMHDVIYFIADPLVDVTYTPSSKFGPASISWGFDPNQPITSVIYWVYTGWLLNPATMPGNVATFLQGHNITPSQYPQMLKADPFASGYTPGEALDPSRFEYLTQLDFIPVLDPGDKPALTQYEFTRNDTTITTNTSTVNYSVSVTIGNNWPFASISVNDTYSWSASTSVKDSTGTTTGENLILAQPTYGYVGPTIIRVYVDKIWKTYFFAQDFN